ncbi:MAG: nuclear transport factor 2 family protein [Thermoleophilaceae bacterium]
MATNAEFVRSAYTVLTDRAFLEWVERALPPEFEWHPFEELPDSRVRRGPEEIKRFFAEALADWPDWRPEPKDVHEVGEDQVVVTAFGHTTSRHGVEGTIHFTQVWEFDDGRPLRVREFLDHTKALEVVRQAE